MWPEEDMGCIQEKRRQSWQLHLDFLRMLGILFLMLAITLHNPTTDFSVRPHTLSPMHLIVPISSCASGDKTLSIASVFPVFSPGLSADLPLKISTRTSFPARSAAPTSTAPSAGCPRRMAELLDFGMKRTRPVVGVRYVQWYDFGDF